VSPLSFQIGIEIKTFRSPAFPGLRVRDEPSRHARSRSVAALGNTDGTRRRDGHGPVVADGADEQIDFTNENSVNHRRAHLVARFGRTDVCVNAAGITSITRVPISKTLRGGLSHVDIH
jgi:NAD(P)-dependent dehydrogenase (short-subunit alcohol dehydrogenase family)